MPIRSEAPSIGELATKNAENAKSRAIQPGISDGLIFVPLAIFRRKNSDSVPV